MTEYAEGLCFVIHPPAFAFLLTDFAIGFEGAWSALLWATGKHLQGIMILPTQPAIDVVHCGMAFDFPIDTKHMSFKGFQ